MDNREIVLCYSNSPRLSEARQKEIGMIPAFGDPGNKRMPYVL
jgi:hypothetical protein